MTDLLIFLGALLTAFLIVLFSEYGVRKRTGKVVSSVLKAHMYDCPKGHPFRADAAHVLMKHHREHLTYEEQLDCMAESLTRRLKE